MSDARDFDVVLFGASGFVGRLTAEYLARAAPDCGRIGLAGRSVARLEKVQASLGPNAAGWPLLTADASDPASVRRLAGAAGVVATTVGPYRAYGLPLVEACATAGTDYVDLAGEVLFMRETIDRFHETARGSGARIVHSCGFDSIPSDLGVLLLYEAAAADGAGELEDTTLVVRGLKGGFSGGTIASVRHQVDEVKATSQLRKVVGDPFGLSPDRAAEPDLPEDDLRRPVHDDELGIWLAPFVMATVNTRVVRRSNALLDWAYGRSMRYREAVATGAGPAGRVKALAVAGGLSALSAGLAFPPSRTVLDRVLPAPGQGPDKEARRRGFFKIDVHTRTSSGTRYISRIAVQGDPGYTATAVMLAESALCLAFDGDRLPDRAGVLTPATAMGTLLAERLRVAGHTLEASPDDLPCSR